MKPQLELTLARLRWAIATFTWSAATPGEGKAVADLSHALTHITDVFEHYQQQRKHIIRLQAENRRLLTALAKERTRVNPA